MKIPGFLMLIGMKTSVAPKPNAPPSDFWSKTTMTNNTAKTIFAEINKVSM